MNRPTCVAYYLGQFHPTPENDAFWGPGFTEWHNVAKARPLYPGHRQPDLPGRLGFYDLRCQATLQDQFDLAAHIGIDAFCHWHYWFAGRRLLHTPLDTMLTMPDRRVKFMLGWANESWTGVWHGLQNRVLIEQTYDVEECQAHARLIARYLASGQWLEVDGRHPFVIYKLRQIPDAADYLGRLRETVRRESGRDLYIVGNWSPGVSHEVPRPAELGLDAVVITPVAAYFQARWAKLGHSAMWQSLRRLGLGPERRPYGGVARVQAMARRNISGVAHGTIVTGWDNTPRSGRRGLVLTGYDEGSFRAAAKQAVTEEMRNPWPLLFVKSWNEWAEGNVIEPRFAERWDAAAVLRSVLAGAATARAALA